MVGLKHLQKLTVKAFRQDFCGDDDDDDGDFCDDDDDDCDDEDHNNDADAGQMDWRPV